MATCVAALFLDAGSSCAPAALATGSRRGYSSPAGDDLTSAGATMAANAARQEATGLSEPGLH